MTPPPELPVDVQGPEERPEPQAYAHQPGRSNERDERPHRPETITAWATGVIAVATIVYSVVSALQLSEIKQSKEVAQRAWVTVSEMKFEVSVGSPLKFITDIENSGNSPAVIVDSWYDTALVRAGERPGLNWSKEEEGAREPLPLAPGQTIIGPKRHLRSDQSELVVTPILAAAIKKKTEVLYRYGFIKYRDTFGKLRKTRYCFWYDGEQHSFACSEPGSNTFD